MDSSHYLSTYVSKLNHPLTEIRERALQLLRAKLLLGWELDDEISGTRQLLESLLAWFRGPQPTLQREALELLLTTIKTKSGTYIVKEMGIKKLLSDLNVLKVKIAPAAEETYNDLVETLKFLNTVESEENVMIPRLSIPDITSSESDGTNSSYYNLNPIQSSKESSINNDEPEINRNISEKSSHGIKVLLFPWVDLCPSDLKTMLLIEDALRLLKSTRRCCRFICDVFLRDFPVEIFLNRPGIIQSLISISEGNNGGKAVETLRVLLCITNALRNRILQLSSFDLIHDMDKISDDYKDLEDDVHSELEQIGEGTQETPKEDGLAALRQIPAPIFALDTLHSVLSMMAQSIVMYDPVNKTELLDMKELNLCLSLVRSLTFLLLECVTSEFWSSEHNYKTHRDIAHKSCTVMRLLGDLLMKYRKSFYEDSERCHHRIAWLRLLSSTEKLLSWARDSALPPTAIVIALQVAQMDPVLELFYPQFTKELNEILQVTRVSTDQEYRAKHKQLKKLCISMDEAVKFMKNKNQCRSNKNVMDCIKKSLPVLEIFQSEVYLKDIAEFILLKTKKFDMDESDWLTIRSIALNLMANNLEWVSARFYQLLAEMVKSVLTSEELHQKENEKCLTLLFDVSLLTEICCHGLSSKIKEVEESASEIMLYLLRGRMVLTDSCWWRLLASILPVFPLLHVYAAHDTQLGQAICKSLDKDIADCMGVSTADIVSGYVRLLFVRCVAVQLEAAHSLCKMLDDEKYLPPRETLRADVLLNALRRLKPHNFNVDLSSSPSKTPVAVGLTQMLDVLKQDIVLEEHSIEYLRNTSLQPTLEPSLRRNTLQQLSVVMRQQDTHETFLQCDGLKLIVAILRMSLLVDDYLAFPECAISCVSIINSVCFASRHTLSKISDLPMLLIRVILVFPANDSAVLMCAQVLAMVSWAGFALHELDESRRRVPALPACVTHRTSLPFIVNSYWNSSPNAEHSYVEWLLAEEDWRTAIRIHWWCANAGYSKVLLDAPPPPAPMALRPTTRDLALIRTACPVYSISKCLLALENATSHRQVNDALNILESYTYLIPLSSTTSEELVGLPWQHTKRFFSAPPASPRDAALLVSLMQFVIAYMDNVPSNDGTMNWIKSSFIGNDASIISLLNRSQLYPQQTSHDCIEVTQVHIHIIKILIRCIILVEKCNDYSTNRMESLIKILLSCLEKINLRDFHMLGYLNEVMRCIRYALNSHYCHLSEETLVNCLKITTQTLSGCASGGGRKGQACRLDAMLSLLALLRQIHEDSIPVPRWNEAFNNDVVQAIVKCAKGETAELRATSLHVIAALAHYAQLLPHILQAIEEQSLSEYAARIFSENGEANIVRGAAASLLASIASRASAKSDILASDVLEQLEQNNFIEKCLEILVNFCNRTDKITALEPNVSLSMLERRSEMEVRAQKGGDVHISPVPVNMRVVYPTASLVANIADVLNNVSAFGRCPVQDWNGRGLYRLLFRVASSTIGTTSENYCVRAASCRALVAVASHKCVRTSLATTKDCLHNLMTTLIAFEQDETDPECLTARAQALLLVASLLEDNSAVDTVWTYIKEDKSNNLLILLLQCLESDETELQDTSLYCLTQLAQSARRKFTEKSRDASCIEFYDNLKLLFEDGNNDKLSAGDSARRDECHPEYMAEEICKALINLYNKISLENKIHESGQDERWVRVSACLSSVLTFSDRSRRYCMHRQLSKTLSSALQAVRDNLSVRAKPNEVIKNAQNNPTLRTLYWLLTLINCCMIECQIAKEAFVDENLAVSLNRLWTWCMLTDQLRHAVMHMLYNFTNECPKAWSAMCVCVSGHSLIVGVCALCEREASLQATPRPDTLLLLALQTITHCQNNHHCRSLILKSNVIESVCKMCVRERSRAVRNAGAGAGAGWARLCVALAGHAEGGASVLQAAAPRLTALPPHLRAALMPAVAHAATHHRYAFLQSPDLLELLSGTLLTGDVAETISAGRAVWALAANNHKAKLLLRSAGVVTAVQTALQRLQQSPKDPITEKGIQLLTYTNNVLQCT